MILSRIPVSFRIHGIGVFFVILAFGAGIAVSFSLRAPVVHQTKTVHVPPAQLSVSQVLAAWGVPDQSAPGAQLNANLAGLTCDIYRSKRVMVCH